MAFAFRMADAEIADYRWGTLVTRTAGFASARGASVTGLLDWGANGVSSWKTGLELRIIIAYEHEIVHLQQDILTGVGHWDFTVRRQHTSTLTRLAGRRLGGLFDDADRQQVTRIREQMNGELLLLPFELQPAATRKALTRAYLRFHTTQLGIPSVANPELYELTIESSGVSRVHALAGLLEAEAAATAALQLRNAIVTNEQQELAQDHEPLFNPAVMVDLYRLPLEHLTAAFHRTFGVPDADRQATFEDLVRNIFIFLVDLACAYPPRPIHERANDIPAVEWDPGVRYLNMVNAFLLLTPDDTENFLGSVAEGDFETAETILLGQSPIPYATREAVYAAWLQVFDKALANDDDAIVRLRSRACQWRLDHPDWHVKSARALYESPFPYYYAHPGGLNFIMREDTPLTAEDFSRLQIENHLMDAILDEGPYCCALAEFRTCPARQALCESGVTAVAELPAAGCRVRDALNVR